MVRFQRMMLRGIAYPFRTARNHPLAALLVGCVTLILAATSLHLYAHYQWRAAQAALATDRPEAARDHLKVCLIIWPQNIDVHLMAARATRLSGDVAAAEAYLNKCLQLHGGATEAVQLEFLLMRVQTGEVDAVAPTLLDSVEKDHPESPIILETLSRAYITRLRYKPAYACLSRWIEIRPDVARAYQWRGWVLERLSHHKQAIEDYHKALELDPELLPVRVRIAELLLEDKQAPEALPHLERAYRQAPDHPAVLARLGMCRYLQGQSEEARQLMEAALPRMPDDPALLIYLARLDLDAGQATTAEQRLRTLLANDPSDTEALYTLVTAIQAQGRTDESVAALREYEHYKAIVDRINTLLKEHADDPKGGAAVAAELGDLLLQVGRESTGLYWLDQALIRDPGHQDTHKILADYYDRKGTPEKAAAHRRQLREPDQAANR